MSVVPAQRVVIFGREGLAREQLVAALSDLGVKPIWVGKPVQSDPEKLSEMNPSQIIISLEPMIESELLPYSDFLSQSEISVLYDDAESTRHLSGWDLNRWARHMASKLLNRDYMPPAPGLELKAGQADQDIEHEDAFSGASTESDESDAELSVESGSIAEAGEFEDQAFDWQSADHYGALDINASELSAALDMLSKNLSDSSEQDAIADLDFGQQIPQADSDFLEFQSQAAIEPSPSGINHDLQLEAEEEFELNGFDVILENEVSDEQQSVYMDEAALKLAERNLEAQLANSGVKTFSAPNLELQTSETESIAAVPAAEAKPKPREFDLSKFSLVGDEESIEADLPAAINQPAADDIKLTERNPVSEHSLFLIISGVGGPGVVRSIVGKINSNFSGIVVLAQAIEAAQLPKFLIQLQKVVSIPVIMPIDEEYLKSGNVYLLPENHTIQLTAHGYQCVSHGSMSGFIAQADQNVEIVVLSGSDATLAQSLIQVSSIMTNIHVQAPEDCFDATLPQLLVNMGVPVIRQEILDTWFN